MLDENHPRQIHIAGRTVRCDSTDDRALLGQAKSIEIDSAFAATLTIGRLHLVKDACQKYSLGKHQRLVKLAIERHERLRVYFNFRKPTFRACLKQNAGRSRRK